MIKLDNINRILAVKKAEMADVFKKALFKGFQMRKEGKSNNGNPNDILSKTNLPCKMHDIPTYDIELNDTYKEAVTTMSRLDKIKADMESLSIDHIMKNAGDTKF